MDVSLRGGVERIVGCALSPSRIALKGLQRLSMGPRVQTRHKGELRRPEGRFAEHNKSTNKPAKGSDGDGVMVITHPQAQSGHDERRPKV